MPGPKLAVRIAVIAFGLLMIGGAWIVSQGENRPSDPSARQAPGPSPAD